MTNQGKQDVLDTCRRKGCLISRSQCGKYGLCRACETIVVERLLTDMHSDVNPDTGEDWPDDEAEAGERVATDAELALPAPSAIQQIKDGPFVAAFDAGFSGDTNPGTGIEPRAPKAHRRAPLDAQCIDCQHRLMSVDGNWVSRTSGSSACNPWNGAGIATQPRCAAHNRPSPCSTCCDS